MEYGHETFLSPFTWRYGSQEMREIFSEKNNRRNWRKVWVALARAQKDFGLVTDAELREIDAHSKDIDLEASHEIEKEIRHDVMAEILVYSRQCRQGGGKIHLGATSMDIEDNADVLRQKQALKIVKKRLLSLLAAFSLQIKKYKSVPCMAYTHLQPAEPTTVGYRFANYAQDLYTDLLALDELEKNLKGKGMKGAVGTSASYFALVKHAKQMEDKVMAELGLQAFEVSTQTYPRKQDYTLCCLLASIASSLHKMAFDVRILQSPLYGEVSEPFKEKQVGSSAMPFKRNPVSSERICSLARLVSSYPDLAWNNAANSLLERTLDDSANRRVFIPEAFLALDEALLLAAKVVSGLEVNRKAVERNLDAYAAFSATEPLLMALVEKGFNRQKMHEVIRAKSMHAWREVQEGRKNPLKKLLAEEKIVKKAVPPKKLEEIFDARKHVGDASLRAEEIAKKIDEKTRGSRIERVEPKF